MGRFRSLVRGVAARVASVVQRDGLFEKPGERPAATPLPERAPVKAAAATGKPAAAVKAASAAKPAEAPKVPEAARAPEKPAAVSKPVEAPEAAPPAATPAPSQARVYRWTGTKPQRPVEGCAPVGLDGLKAALTPSGKPLVINHWATWCDPCVDELPRLVRAAAGVADLGEFLGVSWDLFDHPGKPALVAKKVAKFADSAGVGYPSVLFVGEPTQLFALCGLDVELIPQTIVVAPDGRIVWHKQGVVDHDDVFPLIQAVKEAAR